MRQTYALTRHYLLSMKRNPARVIEILIWPAFEVALFAILASSEYAGESAAYRLTVTILTGIVFWNFTARIIQETVAQFVDDFLSKNIQNILVAPIGLAELLTGLTMASVLKLLFSLAALALVLLSVYPAFFSALGIHTLLWVFQLGLAGIAFSFFAVAAVFLYGERVSFAGWILSTVTQVFSLVFYPRTALPGVLHAISYAIPSSYVFESVHGYEPGSAVLSAGQITAFLISVGYFLAGTVAVSAAFRQAKRRGTLTKL